MTAQIRSRFGRRLAWLAVAGMAAAALIVPTSSSLAAEVKLTICHATGSASNPYTAIKVPESAGFAPHLDDNGNPLNGHEQDFLLENTNLTDCDDVPDPTPTDAPPTATPTDAPPTATPTDAPPTATPTGDVGGATGTPAGTVAGATSDPTLPTTSTIDGANGPLNDGWRVILLGLAAVLAVALLLTPASAVVRKDDASR